MRNSFVLLSGSTLSKAIAAITTEIDTVNRDMTAISADINAATINVDRAVKALDSFRLRLRTGNKALSYADRAQHVGLQEKVSFCAGRVNRLKAEAGRAAGVLADRRNELAAAQAALTSRSKGSWLVAKAQPVSAPVAPKAQPVTVAQVTPAPTVKVAPVIRKSTPATPKAAPFLGRSFNISEFNPEFEPGKAAGLVKMMWTKRAKKHAVAAAA
jgi:hypothetical protein